MMLPTCRNISILFYPLVALFIKHSWFSLLGMVNMQLSLIDGRSSVMFFVDPHVTEFLANFADEFLVHGVDVEGKK